MAKINNLLKEAIADAKAVRETAIENAKIALEEAFEPTVKKMLSAKIQNEMEDFEDENEDELEEEDEIEDEDEIAVEPEEGEEEAIDDIEDEEEVEEDINLDELDDDEEDEEELEPEVEEDIDEELEEILSSLEEEEGDEEEIAEPEFEDEDEVEEDVKLEEEAEEEEDDEDIDLDEAILDYLKEEDDEIEDEDEEEAEVELENLRKENKDYHDTVVFLRSKLNEINLLNAKLLFTNKLFKRYTLSNDQKMKIIEQFDRARNVREIKLTFTTLVESYNSVANPIHKKKGSASKVIKSTKSEKINEDVLVEGAQFKERFKKLANIL